MIRIKHKNHVRLRIENYGKIPKHYKSRTLSESTNRSGLHKYLDPPLIHKIFREKIMKRENFRKKIERETLRLPQKRNYDSRSLRVMSW